MVNVPGRTYQEALRHIKKVSPRNLRDRNSLKRKCLEATIRATTIRDCFRNRVVDLQNGFPDYMASALALVRFKMNLDD